MKRLDLRTLLCDSCRYYKPFTLTTKAKLRKGDVCDECKLDPPRRCSVCDRAHHLEGNRCKECEEEDLTKESVYCVVCHGHYIPSKSKISLTSTSLAGEAEEEDDEATKKKVLQLCDPCIEKCCIPYPLKPYENYVERRNVLG